MDELFDAARSVTRESVPSLTFTHSYYDGEDFTMVSVEMMRWIRVRTEYVHSLLGPHCVCEGYIDREGGKEGCHTDLCVKLREGKEGCHMSLTCLHTLNFSLCVVIQTP